MKNRIEAKRNGSQIEICDKEDKSLDNTGDAYLNWSTQITLGSAAGNSGYQSIFMKRDVSKVDQTVSDTGSLTLDAGSRTVGGSLTITAGGTTQSFNGTSLTDLADKINAAQKEEPVRFTDAATGVFSASASGSSRTVDKSYAGGTNTASGQQSAVLVIGPALTDSMTVTAGVNDTMTFTINGTTKTLTLDAGAYNQNQLKDELQAKIYDATNGFGKGLNGATVSLSNNRLLLTTDQVGGGASITAYGKNAAGVSNTFFDGLTKSTTTETAAVVKSKQPVAGSITLKKGVNNIFHFSYTDRAGTNHTVDLDLTDAADPGETFTAEQLVARMQDKLTAGGHKVSASLENGGLKLATTEVGANTEISYDTSTGAASAIFERGNAVGASVTLDQAIKDTASFTGETKKFCFSMDGVDYELGIANGWTSRTDFVTKLNAAISATTNAFGASLDAQLEASLVGDRLCLTRKTSGFYLSVSYDKNKGADSVTGAMFGITKTGLSATVSGNKLILTAADPGDQISVRSANSAGILEKIPVTTYSTTGMTQTGTGYHSAQYSKATSVNLSGLLNAGKLKITDWNNRLTFKFGYDNGTNSRTFDLTLTKGDRTLDEIKDELNTAFQNQLGGDLKAEVQNNNQLVFTSQKAGKWYRFFGLSDGGRAGGSFFHNVMSNQGLKVETVTLNDPADVNGDQRLPNGDIYAKGRHDVVMDLTKLKENLSDTLILDLNYIKATNGTGQNKDTPTTAINRGDVKTLTLELKLDPNKRPEDYYNASTLQAEIQKKLNEALKAAGKFDDINKRNLYENLIEVKVGAYSTDAPSGRDSVSLSFSLTTNPDISTPGEGYFYIDGIRGNAAYETFYHSKHELSPAYLTGTKDIREGVELGPDDTELSVVIDDVEYTIKLDAGKYSADGIKDAITKKCKEQNIPLIAELTEKGSLKLAYTRMGRHVIEMATGSAREELFFSEKAQRNPFQERNIRVSSFEGDRLALYSPQFSTTLLNVNSLCVSDIKYAEKATGRIKEAIVKVGDMRSTLGTIQNRLSHTINNNQNKEENLQASESRIRDTDLSAETVSHASLGILMQAGQAVLAQANQSRQGMLSLLQ